MGLSPAVCVWPLACELGEDPVWWRGGLHQLVMLPSSSRFTGR